MAHQAILTFQTRGRGTQDITREVAEVVAASRIACGLVQVFVQRTRCSLTITENADPDVRRDLDTIFQRLAPDGHPAFPRSACCLARGKESSSGNTEQRPIGARLSSPSLAEYPGGL